MSGTRTSHRPAPKLYFHAPLRRRGTGQGVQTRPASASRHHAKESTHEVPGPYSTPAGGLLLVAAVALDVPPDPLLEDLVAVAALVVALDDVADIVAVVVVVGGVVVAVELARAGVVVGCDAVVVVIVVVGAAGEAGAGGGGAVELGVVRVELLGVFGRVVVLS